MPWLSGPGQRKEMESPPRLGLGTIYKASFVEELILLLEYEFGV